MRDVVPSLEGIFNAQAIVRSPAVHFHFSEFGNRPVTEKTNGNDVIVIIELVGEKTKEFSQQLSAALSVASSKCLCTHGYTHHQ